MSELTQERWAVVVHNGVWSNCQTYAEAFAQAERLKGELGLTAAVVTDEAAHRFRQDEG